jgi:hypothetical protein
MMVFHSQKQARKHVFNLVNECLRESDVDFGGKAIDPECIPVYGET